MVMVDVSTPRSETGYPPIGVGTWAWGNQFLWQYEPEQDPQLRRCFERAIQLGLRFFDTADSYGTGRFQGRSELLLGTFCSGLSEAERQQVVVATKLAPFPWRLGRGGFVKAFQASRARLQGKLDRVQLHWSTARYAPWQETPLLDGLADLVEAGLVQGLGVSNMGPQRLRQIHQRLAQRGVPLRSVQVQLSLLAPEPIRPGGVATVCRELGIELIAYSPLALGLLARHCGDRPDVPRGPRGFLLRRLWPRMQPLLEEVARIAAAHDSEPAAVALNWCRAHGAVPIPGMRRPAHADSAAAALGWKLGDEERETLDRMALRSRARMPANPFQSD